MAANVQPIFTLTPHVSSALVSTANTLLDGTGTVVTIYTAGTNGSTVENIHVKAVGTTTAGMIRIFLHDGAAFHLIHEISVTAITPSGTVQSFEADWVPPNTLWTIPTGYSVRASTNNAESFQVTVVGGDY